MIKNNLTEKQIDVEIPATLKHRPEWNWQKSVKFVIKKVQR